MTVATGATGPTNVVQTTGTSTTAVMSQKAVTDLFYTKAEIDKMYSYEKYVGNGDLNDYKSEGVIGLVLRTMLNRPTTDDMAYWVRVIACEAGTTAFCQEAISIFGNPRIYYRNGNRGNNTFTPWVEK